MTSQEKDQLRSRLYAAYATTHAGRSDTGRLGPRLPQGPAAAAPAGARRGGGRHRLRPGRSRGVAAAEGYHRAGGIDVSPEQVAIAHERGRDAVRLGTSARRSSRRPSTSSSPRTSWSTSTSSRCCRSSTTAGRPCAPAVGSSSGCPTPSARSAAATGTVTRPTSVSFTARSLRQLLAAAGFDEVEVHPCEPAVHRVTSAARWLIWKVAAGLMKLVLSAETGVPRGHLVTQNVVVSARARGDAPR